MYYLILFYNNCYKTIIVDVYCSVFKEQSQSLRSEATLLIYHTIEYVVNIFLKCLSRFNCIISVYFVSQKQLLYNNNITYFGQYLFKIFINNIILFIIKYKVLLYKYKQINHIYLLVLLLTNSGIESYMYVINRQYPKQIPLYMVHSMLIRKVCSSRHLSLTRRCLLLITFVSKEVIK